MPLQRHGQQGPLNPGLASPGTFRPRGFSPPRRVPPLLLCAPEGTLPLLGFLCSFAGSGRPGLARCRAAALLRCDVTRSQALRNMRSATPLSRGTYRVDRPVEFVGRTIKTTDERVAVPDPSSHRPRRADPRRRLQVLPSRFHGKPLLQDVHSLRLDQRKVASTEVLPPPGQAVAPNRRSGACQY